MTIASPIRLDRLQLALQTVLSDALGSHAEVGWAYGEGLWDDNFPSGNAVNMTLISGPNFHNQNCVRGEVFVPPTTVNVKVDSATANERYIIAINEYNYYHDATALDTVTTIRDALVALIVADTESPFTAAPAVAVDELTVTPDAVGSIWQMAVSNQMTGTPTLSSQAVLKVQDTRRFTVAFGCFSKERFPRSGAWDIAARAQAALTSPQYLEVFNQYGIAVWGKSPTTDLSDIAGGHWESRVNFDVDFSLRSTFTTDVERIEHVGMTLNLSAPTETVTFTVDKP